jgi:2,3-bisphosphoglycerate-dependent phosphoglycerate mutase
MADHDDRDRFDQRPFELPDGATEIILVRHGASEAAVPGVRFPLIDGRSDPPLAASGYAQADSVAAQLAAEDVDALYVSPLRRTSETAAPLAAVTGLEPEVVPELAEVYLGVFEGGEYRVRAGRNDPIILQVFAEERWDAIPGAESLDDLGARVRRAVARIVEQTGPDAVAVAFVHGAVIGELCRQATGSRPFAFVHADNGSMTRLVVNPDGRWLLRSFNDVSHLTIKTGPVG